MTTPQTDTALEDYYKLKSQYEGKYERQKAGILSSDMSNSDKRKKVALLKRKCIKCDRPVGTVFQRQGRILTAACGETTMPCSLDIKIDRGEYVFGPTLVDRLIQDVEQQKKTIIEIKLNLLFGIETEETTLEMFEKIKAAYKKSQTLLDDVQNILQNNDLVEIDQIGGEREIAKRELVRINKIELGKLVKGFKVLIAELDAEEAEDAKLTELEEAMEIYLDQIVPVLKTIRENQYDVVTVIEQPVAKPAANKFKLIQLETTISKQQLIVESAKVISNVK